VKKFGQDFSGTSLDKGTEPYYTMVVRKNTPKKNTFLWKQPEPVMIA
jgi:hypothetical protein